MDRRWQNFAGGLTTDDPLLLSATTINSPGFSALPVIEAPHTLRLVLDPDGNEGLPEIVTVTTHSLAATSVTVVRGQEEELGGSPRRQHSQGTVWICAVTALSMEDIQSEVVATQGDVGVLQGEVATKIDEASFDTAGDLLVGTGLDAFTNVPVGADGRVLVADSGAGAGVSWQDQTPPADFVHIDTVTPTSGTTFSFDNIPQDFEHLVVAGSVRHNNASGDSVLRFLNLRFNGDTGLNYHSVLNARTFDGTAVNFNSSGGAQAAGRCARIGLLMTAFRLHVPNYTATVNARLTTSYGSAGGTFTPGTQWETFEAMTRWLTSAAITEIGFQISAGGDVFGAANTVSLYGLRG